MTLPSSSLMTPRYTEMMRGKPWNPVIYYQREKKAKKTKKKKKKVENPLTRVTRRKKRGKERRRNCGIFSRRDDAKFGVGNGGFATPRNLPTTTSGEQNGVEETSLRGSVNATLKSAYKSLRLRSRNGLKPARAVDQYSIFPFFDRSYRFLPEPLPVERRRTKRFEVGRGRRMGWQRGEGVSATVAFSSLRVDCVGKFQAANIASFVHIMIFPDCFARLISTTSFDDPPIALDSFRLILAARPHCPSVFSCLYFPRFCCGASGYTRYIESVEERGLRVPGGGDRF